MASSDPARQERIEAVHSELLGRLGERTYRDKGGFAFAELLLEAADTVEPVPDYSGEAARLREELWQCYLESGEDPDGGDARHLNPSNALRAVRQLRKDYDDDLNTLR